jgi:hypothetical protein
MDYPIDDSHAPDPVVQKPVGASMDIEGGDDRSHPSAQANRHDIDSRREGCTSLNISPIKRRQWGKNNDKIEGDKKNNEESF